MLQQYQIEKNLFILYISTYIYTYFICRQKRQRIFFILCVCKPHHTFFFIKTKETKNRQCEFGQRIFRRYIDVRVILPIFLFFIIFLPESMAVCIVWMCFQYQDVLTIVAQFFLYPPSFLRGPKYFIKNGNNYPKKDFTHLYFSTHHVGNKVSVLKYQKMIFPRNNHFPRGFFFGLLYIFFIQILVHKVFIGV